MPEVPAAAVGEDLDASRSERVQPRKVRSPQPRRNADTRAQPRRRDAAVIHAPAGRDLGHAIDDVAVDGEVADEEKVEVGCHFGNTYKQSSRNRTFTACPSGWISRCRGSRSTSDSSCPPTSTSYSMTLPR